MQDSKRGSRTTIDRDVRRTNRVPVGAGNKLEFMGKDPGYHYRVVNDVPGRVGMFQKAGYDFCTSEVREMDKGIAEGEAADTRIVINSGQGVKSYLMRIPIEFYNEDQARKIEAVKQTEDQMRNKNPDPKRGVYGGLSDE
jgi:hypothetical protein